jgi:hypothetical protein
MKTLHALLISCAFALPSKAQEAARTVVSTHVTPSVQVDTLESNVGFGVDMYNIEPLAGTVLDVSSHHIFSYDEQRTTLRSGFYGYNLLSESLSHGLYPGMQVGYMYSEAHTFIAGPLLRYGFSLGPFQLATYTGVALEQELASLPDARASMGGYARFDFDCGLSGVEHPFGACRVGTDALSTYSLLKRQDTHSFSVSLSVGLAYGLNTGVRVHYEDTQISSLDGNLGAGIFLEWFNPF